MKKIIFIALLLLTVSVKAADAYKPLSSGSVLTICDTNDKNCTNVDEKNLKNGMIADNFEIRNDVIYLSNVNISMGIYRDNLTFNVDGKNIIKRLVNTTNNGISNGESYNHINIEGNGTLEIVNYDKYNENEDGEKYYAQWVIRENKVAIQLIIANLIEVEDGIMFNIPENGWTISELVNMLQSDKYYNLVYAGFSKDQINAPLNPDKAGRYDYFYDYVELCKKRYEEITGIPYPTSKEVIEYYIGKEIDAFYPVSTPTKANMEWAKDSIVTNMPVSLTKADTVLVGEEPIELVNIVQENNIILEVEDGLNSAYSLNVEDIIKNANSEEMAKIEEKTGKVLLSLYDINVLDENNEIVKISDGKYKIRIKIDDLIKKYENFIVVYIGNNYDVEELKTTGENNYLEFETSHLSKYGIVGTAIKSSIIPIVNPATADKMYMEIIMFIAFLSVSIFSCLKIKKIKNA